ncbi:MAG: hypothetical protein Q8O55_06655 [Dehalococcoidales bacterium]|nr:hypothetical protein [Dehalococcoidales bacterium]
MTIIEGKQYDLSKLYAVPDACTRENHGVSREGVWVTKSGRVIVKTNSIWASGRNDGTTVGTQYRFVDEDEIASLAAELDDPRLVALVPVAEEE